MGSSRYTAFGLLVYRDRKMPTAVVTFSEVAGEPKVRLDLPLVRLGDRLMLQLRLQRRNAGRTEELRVAGEFKVASLVLDARNGIRQLVGITATGAAPKWHPIKNPPPSRFPLKGLKVPAQD